MQITQKPIRQAIDDLLIYIYPKVQQYLVSISSNSDSYAAHENEAFIEFKNEVFSIFNYDVKLVFPAILSVVQPTKNFKNFDILAMLNLLQKKEERIAKTFLEFKKSLSPENQGKREKDFMAYFQQEFMPLHKKLEQDVKHWVQEKVRS